MRVLVVHSRYRSPSGEEAVVEREIDLLAAASHTVDLLEFRNGGGARSALDLAVAAHNPRAARRLADRLAAFRPDVVHVHNTWFAASPSVMSETRRRGVPVVATLHNYRAICAGATLLRDGVECTECVGASALPGLRHRCVNGSVVQSLAGTAVVVRRRRGEQRSQLAHRYIAPTQVLADRMVEGGIPADRLTVLPHFAPEPPAVTAVPSASRTLLFAGRLSAEKGIAEAIEAWRRWSDRPVDARFVIAGEGPMEAELRRDPPPGVEFVGRVPSADVGALIDAARCVVVPSLWSEPFGLVYLEAMARGVPVLSSAMGGAPGFLAGGGGWLVEPGDIDGLHAKMSELFDDAPATRERVDAAGRAGRATFVADYSPAAHLERLMAVFDEVIASNGAGDVA